ncbi:ABC transporter permease [Knoellia subterranea]|uniref:ABC transporter n=1 Tax=Knoellia subterranea KCTC 19937 TaxID=1385521 RepID=A0A0A0JFX7_9MICO|nr:ABC transporter permease [Knoellia subterranea]KGN35679.1 ABC transporter [Knoellia subterranea KCTC 19937]
MSEPRRRFSDGPVVERVDVSRLSPVGRRPSLGSYIAQLWGRRHFIWADSRARAFAGNRDTLLGRFWLVGKPILDGATYFLIFGVMLNASRGVENYVGFLIIGVFMFQFTAKALTGGAGAMAAGKNIIRAFTFPRASIPLALVLRETISMLPVLVTMLAMILLIPPHAQVSIYWLLFPVVFLLQALFNTGLTLYAARLASAIPDLRLVLGFVSRFWMYGSGVMYSIDRFVSHPTLLAAMQLNPAYCVLEISRDLLLYARMPDMTLWLTLGAWAVITPLFGFIYFWHGEEEYGRE